MFDIYRTSNTRCMDIEALGVDAFAQLGIEARLASLAKLGVGAPDRDVDLVLDPEGVGVPLQVKHRSLVTDDVADRLLAEALPMKAALLVVADRVTDVARRALTSRSGGYLDLRGRLALRTNGLVIDAEVEPVKERAERAEALSGKAGVEVATALMMRSERPVAVRELALDQPSDDPGEAPTCSTSCASRSMR